MATKRKLIKVTKKHIKDGVRGKVTGCPVALAVQEQAPVDGRAFAVCSFMAEYYTFDPGYKTSKVKIPKSVGAFINKFDKKKPVKPFNFFLEVPKI